MDLCTETENRGDYSWKLDIRLPYSKKADNARDLTTILYFNYILACTGLVGASCKSLCLVIIIIIIIKQQFCTVGVCVVQSVSRQSLLVRGCGLYHLVGASVSCVCVVQSVSRQSLLVHGCGLYHLVGAGVSCG